MLVYFDFLLFFYNLKQEWNDLKVMNFVTQLLPSKYSLMSYMQITNGISIDRIRIDKWKCKQIFSGTDLAKAFDLHWIKSLVLLKSNILLYSLSADAYLPIHQYHRVCAFHSGDVREDCSERVSMCICITFARFSRTSGSYFDTHKWWISMEEDKNELSPQYLVFITFRSIV